MFFIERIQHRRRQIQTKAVVVATTR